MSTRSCSFTPSLCVLTLSLNIGCSGIQSYCKDADGDGYGDPAMCESELLVDRDLNGIPDAGYEDYIVDDSDCDDADAELYPGIIALNGDYSYPDLATVVAALSTTSLNRLQTCGITEYGGVMDISDVELDWDGYGSTTITGGTGSGLAAADSTVSISAVTFTDCSADSSTDKKGGGLWLNGSTMTLTDVTVTANYADEHGGGLYVTDTMLVINDSTVSGNSAGSHADGFYIRGASEVELNDTNITDHVNKHGLYVRDDESGQDITVTLNRVYFANNFGYDLKWYATGAGETWGPGTVSYTCEGSTEDCL